MPLLVQTRVAPSPIEGLGLFAATAIPAGTVVWRFDERFDRIVGPGEDALATYPSLAHIAEAHACLIEGLGLLLFADDARYVNHADKPAVGRARADDWRVFHALRDIAAGEEITCDYEDICEAVRAVGAEAFLETAAGSGANA